MLQVTNLSKSFDDNHVLSEISFQVKQGETVCILGPSGCGKTTLLNILVGLGTGYDGDVIANTKKISFLFQERELMPWRTVLDNTTLGLEFQGFEKAQAQERATTYLNQLKLGHVLSLYPHQISGGMKRRVALAQVLSNHPDILFLDEPLTGLDVNDRRRVSTMIKNYTKKQKAAAVIVTHSIEEAIFLADRLIVLSGSPATVAQDLMLSKVKEKNIFDYILKTYMQANPGVQDV